MTEPRRRRNSTFRQRTTPIPRVPAKRLRARKPWPAPEGREPKIAPRRRVGTATGLPLPPPEFTREVKLTIRTRAGNGDPEQALCEAHGDFLGLHGGEYQHVVARGMGGSRDRVINSAAGGILLCAEAHRLAETRDPGMRRLGFWLPQGTDPRLAPMTLYGLSGGSRIIRRAEAEPRYLEQAPGEMAA